MDEAGTMLQWAVVWRCVRKLLKLGPKLRQYLPPNDIGITASEWEVFLDKNLVSMRQIGRAFVVGLTTTSRR